jgi:hypothetical protein
VTSRLLDSGAGRGRGRGRGWASGAARRRPIEGLGERSGWLIFEQRPGPRGTALVMGKSIRIAESNVKFSIRCFSKTCVLLVTGELSG